MFIFSSYPKHRAASLRQFLLMFQGKIHHNTLLAQQKHELIRSRTSGFIEELRLTTPVLPVQDGGHIA